MAGNFGLELRPRDVYAKPSSNSPEEEVMVHPIHGENPDKEAHRTYKTLKPKGEIAVVQRPDGVLKIVVYSGSGEKQVEHIEILLDHHNAFDLAMEILQQAYRLGQAD
jgi:hypothetical protein